jgi:outer membrane receptor protein involved in Fe transport
MFSDDLVGSVSVYQRYNAARLRSNQIGGPVLAEQSRHHSNYGAVGSLTWFKAHNTIKGGFELTRFPLTESFTLAITDLDELLEKEPDLPDDVQGFTLHDPFFFRDHATGWEGSLYLQDHITTTNNFTFDVGARLDGYHFLVDKTFVSPRLGVAYYIPKTKTVVRSSFAHFIETPALENLLLSSSPESRIFSPAGEDGDSDIAQGEPVQVSRETQVDVGFQQQLGDYLRVDSDFYYRRLTNPPEITNFLETGIIFPANLARSRSKGIETRLDLAPVHGFSAFVSYTNLHIYGFAPITGGLFLGEAVDLFSRSGQRVNIEEDQRNTVVFQPRYDYAPWKLWVALLGRHDSGYSVELEPDASIDEFLMEFPAKIVDRVNLDRGFIKPHTTADISIGKEIPVNERLSLTAQFNIENVTDTFYLITFESVFSGTTVGRPRTYTGKLSFNFK